MSDEARTKSGELRLGLATCPRCNGKKSIPAIVGAVAGAELPCPACDASGRVTLSKHHELVGLEPKKED